MSNDRHKENKKHLIDSTKSSKLSANIPSGELQNKWTEYRSKIPLVSPANKKKMNIIVIGTGLAGGSAAASLAELGYNVPLFVFKIVLEEHIQ